MTSAALTAIFLSAEAAFGLPRGLLSAVCYVESGHRPSIVHHDDGGEDSIGECQIHVTTAKELGFKGATSRLLVPKVNAYYSAAYLRKQLERYRWDTVKAVSAYNLGTFRGDRVGAPVNHHYVDKVLGAWEDGR